MVSSRVSWVRLLTGRPILPRQAAARSTAFARAVQTQAPSTSDIQPINRSHEATETKRRRLIWQTRKRGILESDILLSTFAKEELGGMTRAELEEFDKLLDEMDWDIFHWASGAKQPPPKVEQMAVFCKLREYCKNKRVVGARMPELDSQ